MLRIAALLAIGLTLAACSASSSSPTDDAGRDGDPDVGVDLGDEAGTDECLDPDGDGYGPGCPLGDVDCQPFDANSYPGAPEICGDLIDNDCDGLVDEGCPCTNGRVEVCYDGPAATRGVGVCQSGHRTCVDGEWGECVGQVLPRGEVETDCDGLDENCDGEVDEGLTNACGLCGPLPVEVCGDGLDNNCSGVIDDPDAGCDCDGRTGQQCYSGPPHTLGIGVCRGGHADCGDDGAWEACVGERLPAPEVCDGLDNDCDGLIDEGVRNACGVCGAPEPMEICDGIDNNCNGLVDEGLRLPCGLCPGEAGEEICGDGLDNDCDGAVDENCPCTGGTACYPGPPATRGVGACRDGARACDATGEFWGPCIGFVAPSIEVCDGLDNTCDGLVDVLPNGCSVCGLSEEICDGIDNNCNGFIDEGLRNACGDCIADVEPETICNGIDDNCNGFIDEGLTNACGRCDESCYERAWSDPGDWLVGEFDGVDDDDLDAGLRLGATQSLFPDLWVANTDDQTVTRINTDEARAVGAFPVGLDPSRTAVDFDGNVWIANRAFDAQGSVTKIAARGCTGEDCVLFTTPIGAVGDIPRGLAIDREGYAWVGTFTGRALWRVHPTTGDVVETHDVPVTIYGLAIDAEGIIWIATMSSQGIGAFDTNTNRYLGNWAAPGCGTPYGIAVDFDGNVWAGAWRCHGLIRLDRESFEAGTVEVQMYSHSNLRETRGVSVDGTGAIYVAASGTDRLGKFDPDIEGFDWTVATCSTPIGVGVASDGNIWVMCRGSAEARRYSPDGVELDRVPTGRAPYSYSDMTGFQLRNFTAPSGTWRVVFDCGFTECGFDRVRYDAVTPPGTAVTVRARTRTATSGATEWTEWSPSFSVTPAELGSFLEPGRFCEVEVRLTTNDRSVTPAVTSVTVDWQRP